MWRTKKKRTTRKCGEREITSGQAFFGYLNFREHWQFGPRCMCSYGKLMKLSQNWHLKLKSKNFKKIVFRVNFSLIFTWFLNLLDIKFESRNTLKLSDWHLSSLLQKCMKKKTTFLNLGTVCWVWTLLKDFKFLNFTSFSRYVKF